MQIGPGIGLLRVAKTGALACSALMWAMKPAGVRERGNSVMTEQIGAVYEVDLRTHSPSQDQTKYWVTFAARAGNGTNLAGHFLVEFADQPSGASAFVVNDSWGVIQAEGTYGRGILASEHNVVSTVRLEVLVDKAAYSRLLTFVEGYGMADLRYDLLAANCVTFGAIVARRLGLKTPKRPISAVPGAWTLPAQYVKQLARANAAVVKATGGPPESPGPENGGSLQTEWRVSVADNPKYAQGFNGNGSDEGLYAANGLVARVTANAIEILNGSTGRQILLRRPTANDPLVASAMSGGKVIVASRGGRLFAIDLSNPGAPLVKGLPGAMVPGANSMVATSDMVGLASPTAITGVRPQDGSIAWHVALPPNSVASLSFAANGALAAAVADLHARAPMRRLVIDWESGQVEGAATVTSDQMRVVVRAGSGALLMDCTQREFLRWVDPQTDRTIWARSLTYGPCNFAGSVAAAVNPSELAVAEKGINIVRTADGTVLRTIATRHPITEILGADGAAVTAWSSGLDETGDSDGNPSYLVTVDLSTGAVVEREALLRGTTDRAVVLMSGGIIVSSSDGTLRFVGASGAKQAQLGFSGPLTLIQGQMVTLSALQGPLSDPDHRESRPLLLRRHLKIQDSAGRWLHVFVHGLPCPKCEFADGADPVVLTVIRETVPGSGPILLVDRSGCSKNTLCETSDWLTDEQLLVVSGHPVVRLTYLDKGGPNALSFTHRLLVDEGTPSLDSVGIPPPDYRMVARVQGIAGVYRLETAGDPVITDQGLRQDYQVWRGGAAGPDPECCPRGGIVRVTYQFQAGGAGLVLVPVSYTVKDR